MVPTAEARMTRQMLYSALVPAAIASTRVAMHPPIGARADGKQTAPASYTRNVNAMLMLGNRSRFRALKDDESARSYTENRTMSRTCLRVSDAANSSRGGARPRIRDKRQA